MPARMKGSFDVDEVQEKVVVKLALAGSNAEDTGAVYRRIQLGGCSDPYRKLRHRAVLFSLDEAEDNPKDIAFHQFKVLFLYVDVDGDKVIIGSTEELIDAMRQFESKGVLKVTAQVQPKSKVMASPRLSRASCASAESSTQTANPEACRLVSKEPTGSKEGNNGVECEAEFPVKLKGAVESVVGALATAVVALEEHVVRPESSKKTAAAPEDTSPKEPPSSQVKYSNKPPAVKVPEKSAAEKSTGEKSPGKPPATICAKPTRPFIHGRHTCDGCLTTPIIGKRFKARNMADYDLCANCKNNYKGKEIKFEAVELDRDRPMQDRWHRRHAKFGQCGGHRRARRFGGSRRGPHAFHRPTPLQATYGPVLQRPEDIDRALQEAVRRSLQDVIKMVEKPAAEESKGKEPVSEEPKAEEPKAKEATAEESKKFCWWYASEETMTEEPKAEEPKAKETLTEEPKTEEPKTEEPKTEEPKTEEPKTEEQKAESASKSDVDVAATEQKAEFASKPNILSLMELEQEYTTTTKPVTVVVRPQPVRVVGPLRRQQKQQQQEQAQQQPQPHLEDQKAEPGPKPHIIDAKSDIFAEVGEKVNDSFADDAEGSVAKILGQTLDTFAGEIDALRKEHGTTIVDGSINDDTVDDGSRGSWNMIDEDGSMDDDEALARAAQVIGSALFNSATSAGNVSTLSKSDEAASASSACDASADFSSISSVPSTVRSLATYAQRERWAAQLCKLREIGFDDEAACIEVLEHLSAANIGSGEQVEVSVTQVVNELMKDK